MTIITLLDTLTPVTNKNDFKIFKIQKTTDTINFPTKIKPANRSNLQV